MVEGGLIQLGNLASREAILFISGFLLILLLDYHQVPGTIIIGILIIAFVNFLLTFKGLPKLISMPPSIKPILWNMDFSQLNNFNAFKQIFAFILIALFNATGTVIGLLHSPAFKNAPDINRKAARSLLCCSMGTIAAAGMGTSSTSPAIESASGISVGGRTGLTALVISGLFLLSLFISPLLETIPDFAVGAALLYIACCIMKDITRLETHDLTDFAPSIIIIVMIPFSFSIADGIGMGIVSYVLLKLFRGQFKKLNAILVILAALFIFYFIGFS